MNLIETCRQLIAIDSSPANGNVEVVDFVSDLARGLGFAVKQQPEILNGIEQKNIVIRHPESPIESKELLLLTHLDTSDPGSYGLWSETMSNPFKASIYDKKLFGLGSANAKVDFVCKLMAAQKLLSKKILRPFVLAGSFGDQMGMIGALKLIRKKMVNPAFALVGDATELRLVNQGAGLTMVEVTIPFSEEEKEYHKQSNMNEGMTTQSKVFRGKPGLGINAELSDNAIVNMFDYISKLPEGVVVMSMDGGVSPNTVPSTAFLEIDLVGGFNNEITQKISKILEALTHLEGSFKDFPCEGFASEICTINIGSIRTFKDNIKVEGSCRILPSVSDAVAESWMEELRSACVSVGANFQIALNRRPFATQEESEAVELCQRALDDLKLDKNLCSTMVCTEANVLSRLGINSLTVGPGIGVGNTHQPNESVDLEQVDQAILFYEKVLGNYCL